MTNRLTNAGWLDGTSGWAGTSGLTLATDETVRGASGRIVLRGTRTATAAGQSHWLSPASGKRADISGLDEIEVQVFAAAFLGGVAVTPSVRLVFYNASGTSIATEAVAVQRPALALHGVAVAGLTDTFWSARAVFPRPANAVRLSIEVGVTSTASSQTMELVMARPFVDGVNARRRPSVWGPGLHDNTDLQRRNWPSDIPLVGREGGKPKPWALAHDAGAGLPAQRRVSAEPARKLSAVVHVDPVQRERLEAFAADESRFWLMEPESGKLCLAEFDAEGAPALIEHRGGLHHMGLTLWLETF